ncbi:MAG: hypothetical protein SOZ62_03050 [Eubacteriales bacterium]|nr:hypothetical protein [Eubacteriales bacterium]
MYSRTYEKGKIDIPKNYAGMAFGDDRPRTEEQHDCKPTEINDFKKDEYISEKEICDEVHEESDKNCDEKCDDGLFSGIKHIFDGLGIANDSEDILLLALVAILYGNAKKNSSEIALVLLFLLMIK